MRCYRNAWLEIGETIKKKKRGEEEKGRGEGKRRGEEEMEN